MSQYKKKHLIFLESNSIGTISDIISAAKSRGYHTHFLTRKKDEYIGSYINPTLIADEVHELKEITLDEVQKYISETKIEGVFWADELKIPLCAELGYKKNIFSKDEYQALLGVCDKQYVREQTNHLSNRPTAYAVLSYKEVPLESPVGYPCIVKPIDGIGGIGVAFCNNKEAYQEACEVIFQRENYFEGTQVKFLALVEEFIEGKEYSAELAWHHKNGWQLIGYTNKIKKPHPETEEIGHVFPHYFDHKTSYSIYSWLVKCLQKINLKKTVVHVEFILTNDGPRLVEINSRIGGGFIHKLIHYTLSIDMGEIALCAGLGLDFQLPNYEKQKKIAATSFLITDKKLCIEKIILPNKNSSSLKINWQVKTPLLTSKGKRIAAVVCVSKSHQSALEQAQNAIKNYKIEIKNKV